MNKQITFFKTWKKLSYPLFCTLRLRTESKDHFYSQALMGTFDVILKQRGQEIRQLGTARLIAKNNIKLIDVPYDLSFIDAETDPEGLFNVMRKLYEHKYDPVRQIAVPNPDWDGRDTTFILLVFLNLNDIKTPSRQTSLFQYNQMPLVM